MSEQRTLYIIGLPEPGSDKLLVADPKPFPDGTHQEVGRLVPATVEDLNIEALAREIVDQEWTDIYDDLEEYERDRARSLARIYLRAALGGTDE